MRYTIIYFLPLLFMSVCSYAQNLSGQWKGSFNETRGDESTEYVLELDIKGKSVEGVSITYFTLQGKKYFTMCAVEGTYDPSSKTIVSKEVSKVKANTPSWFRDCFQTHTLTFFKKGEEEQLSGTWKSAKREDNCGRGTTLLTRKVLNKKSVAPPHQTVAFQEKNTSPIKAKESSPEIKKEVEVKEKDQVGETAKQRTEESIEKSAPGYTNHKFEKRSNKVFETIELKGDDVYVSIYDNAEIDGDVITVLFNGEIVLANQTLSEQPISFRLKPQKGIENTLTMYAENQGSTPPNTAIMRIQHGDEYRKILLSADDKKNASVIFKIKD